jgi:2-iminobutanoate/2-iminopropanoate deaminase
MKGGNRRIFLGKGLAAGAVAAAATGVSASAQDKAVNKVLWQDGKRPEKTPWFSSTVAYGNLLFIAGVGAHFDGDIKAHTKSVLDSIQTQLEAAGSSMEKVLKCNVYLADLKDYPNECSVSRTVRS